MTNPLIARLADRVLEHGEAGLSPGEAARLAALPEDETVDLFHFAHGITRHFRKAGPPVLCAILNAKSGFCSEDCAFCAQSARHRTGIETFPLVPPERMAERAAEMAERGATRFSIVTSGVALNERERDRVARGVRLIRERTDLAVCASVGMLSEESAGILKESGVTTYHHNLETARSFFHRICTTHAYEEDVETVRIAKKAGLRTCSGGILGLGEGWAERLELAFTLRDLGVDGVPVNFLNPVPGTAMAGRPLLPPLEALKCISLFRFILPGREILVCGGREVTLRDYQSWIFLAGASGLMIGNYLTTAGRNIETDLDMIAAWPGFRRRGAAGPAG
jgi:biotin synthase